MPQAVLPRTVRTSLDILRFQRSRASLPRLRGPETVSVDPSPGDDLSRRIQRVVGILNDLDVRWALVGAHAVGMLTEPRATQDFDFVVESSKIQRVETALREAFGDLGRQDMGPALRFATLDVDMIRSTNHSLFQEALERTRDIEGWRVPIPEVLIALKFLSAISPWRSPEKRHFDIGDLMAMVRAVGIDELDRELMETLAAQVYPGAEREFVDLLGRIERGEAISI